MVLLLVRVVLGTTFILHGSQKLFGVLSGPGIDGWLEYLTSLGVTHHVLGYAAAAFEFFGGLMVLTGIGAELGAAAILITMVGAIYLVHGAHGYFLPNGMEYALNLGLLCVAIICGGAGTYTLPVSFKK